MPMGRLQKVMCDVNYGKVEKYKVDDFFNQRTNKNPRYAKREECSLKGEKDSPYHQKDIKNFQRGQPEKKYNKDDIFETNKKKQTKKIKSKKPIKQYKNEFHTLY